MIAHSMVCDDDAILERPYADRQLVIVVPDRVAQVVEAESVVTQDTDQGFFDRLKLQAQANLDTLKADWKRVEQNLKERKWKNVARSFTAFYLDSSRLFNMATVESLRAWAKASESGIRILAISKTAAQAVIFPPGHPRNGILYVGHPAVAFVYHPMADFHRVIFEHKTCEAIRLLMSLGAKQMRVEHVTGWSKDFSARISVPLGTASEAATIEAGKNSANRRTLLYEATLTGTDKPTLPTNLVWYPHESAWQTVAEGRINFGLRNFSLSVTNADDFGINAGLKVAVTDAGLGLGGKFEDHQSTEWRIEGRFTGP